MKDVSDEMIAWKTEGTRALSGAAEQLHATLKAVEPLREMPADRKQQQMSYRTWNQQDERGIRAVQRRSEDQT